MKVLPKEEFINKTIHLTNLGSHPGFDLMNKKFSCGCGNKHKISNPDARVIAWFKRDLVIMCPDLRCINYVKCKVFGSETIFVSDKV